MAREARENIARMSPEERAAMGLPEVGWERVVWGGRRLGRGRRDGRVRRLARRYHRPMRLIPWEEERLQLFAAAELARRRRAAGLRLNHPEAVALICDAMLEAARAGGSYAEVEAAGRAAVDPGEVLDGVRELLDEVRLEVLLGDGTRVVALVDPLGRGDAPDPLGPGAAGDRRPVRRRDQRRP